MENPRFAANLIVMPYQSVTLSPEFETVASKLARLKPLPTLAWYGVARMQEDAAVQDIMNRMLERVYALAKQELKIRAEMNPALGLGQNVPPFVNALRALIRTGTKSILLAAPNRTIERLWDYITNAPLMTTGHVIVLPVDAGEHDGAVPFLRRDMRPGAVNPRLAR